MSSWILSLLLLGLLQLASAGPVNRQVGATDQVQIVVQNNTEENEAGQAETEITGQVDEQPQAIEPKPDENVRPDSEEEVLQVVEEVIAQAEDNKNPVPVNEVENVEDVPLEVVADQEQLKDTQDVEVLEQEVIAEEADINQQVQNADSVAEVVQQQVLNEGVVVVQHDQQDHANELAQEVTQQMEEEIENGENMQPIPEEIQVNQNANEQEQVEIVLEAEGEQQTQIVDDSELLAAEDFSVTEEHVEIAPEEITDTINNAPQEHHETLMTEVIEQEIQQEHQQIPDNTPVKENDESKIPEEMSTLEETEQQGVEKLPEEQTQQITSDHKEPSTPDLLSEQEDEEQSPVIVMEQQGQQTLESVPEQPEVQVVQEVLDDHVEVQSDPELRPEEQVVQQSPQEMPEQQQEQEAQHTQQQEEIQNVLEILNEDQVVQQSPEIMPEEQEEQVIQEIIQQEEVQPVPEVIAEQQVIDQSPEIMSQQQEEQIDPGQKESQQNPEISQDQQMMESQDIVLEEQEQKNTEIQNVDQSPDVTQEEEKIKPQDLEIIHAEEEIKPPTQERVPISEASQQQDTEIVLQEEDNIAQQQENLLDAQEQITPDESLNPELLEQITGEKQEPVEIINEQNIDQEQLMQDFVPDDNMDLQEHEIQSLTDEEIKEKPEAISIIPADEQIKFESDKQDEQHETLKTEAEETAVSDESEITGGEVNTLLPESPNSESQQSQGTEVIVEEETIVETVQSEVISETNSETVQESSVNLPAVEISIDLTEAETTEPKVEQATVVKEEVIAESDGTVQDESKVDALDEIPPEISFGESEQVDSEYMDIRTTATDAPVADVDEKHDETTSVSKDTESVVDINGNDEEKESEAIKPEDSDFEQTMTDSKAQEEVDAPSSDGGDLQMPIQTMIFPHSEQDESATDANIDEVTVIKTSGGESETIENEGEQQITTDPLVPNSGEDPVVDWIMQDHHHETDENQNQELVPIMVEDVKTATELEQSSQTDTVVEPNMQTNNLKPVQQELNPSEDALSEEPENESVNADNKKPAGVIKGELLINTINNDEKVSAQNQPIHEVIQQETNTQILEEAVDTQVKPIIVKTENVISQVAQQESQKETISSPIKDDSDQSSLTVESIEQPKDTIKEDEAVLVPSEDQQEIAETQDSMTASSDKAQSSEGNQENAQVVPDFNMQDVSHVMADVIVKVEFGNNGAKEQVSKDKIDENEHNEEIVDPSSAMTNVEKGGDQTPVNVESTASNNLPSKPLKHPEVIAVINDKDPLSEHDEVKKEVVASELIKEEVALQNEEIDVAPQEESTMQQEMPEMTQEVTLVESVKPEKFENEPTAISSISDEASPVENSAQISENNPSDVKDAKPDESQQSQEMQSQDLSHQIESTQSEEKPLEQSAINEQVQEHSEIVAESDQLKQVAEVVIQPLVKDAPIQNDQAEQQQVEIGAEVIVDIINPEIHEEEKNLASETINKKQEVIVIAGNEDGAELTKPADIVQEGVVAVNKVIEADKKPTPEEEILKVTEDDKQEIDQVNQQISQSSIIDVIVEEDDKMEVIIPEDKLTNAIVAQEESSSTDELHAQGIEELTDFHDESHKVEQTAVDSEIEITHIQENNIKPNEQKTPIEVQSESVVATPEAVESVEKIAVVGDEVISQPDMQVERVEQTVSVHTVAHGNPQENNEQNPDAQVIVSESDETEQLENVNEDSKIVKEEIPQQSHQTPAANDDAIDEQHSTKEEEVIEASNSQNVDIHQGFQEIPTKIDVAKPIVQEEVAEPEQLQAESVDQVELEPELPDENAQISSQDQMAVPVENDEQDNQQSPIAEVPVQSNGQLNLNSEQTQEDIVEKELEKVAQKYGLKTVKTKRPPKPITVLEDEEEEDSLNVRNDDSVDEQTDDRQANVADRVFNYVRSFFQ